MAEKQNQQTIAYVFLGLMVLFLVLAVTTASGNVTWLLVVSALVFLVVGLVMMTGDGANAGGTLAGGSSQQQSVVLGGPGGRVVSQTGGGPILAACMSCSARIPESAKFCPQCGAASGA